MNESGGIKNWGRGEEGVGGSIEKLRRDSWWKSVPGQRVKRCKRGSEQAS